MSGRLQFRLGELEMLCMEPLHFCDEGLFSEVHQLKGKLTYFQSLLKKDIKEAKSYLKKEVSKSINHVQAVIGKQAKFLLKSSP